MAFPFKDKALWEVTSAPDIYGQQKPTTSQEIDCSIISLLLTPQLTSTGADVSASRGRAGQTALVAKIIVPLSLPIKRKDILIVAPADETGVHLEVQSILTKTNVMGQPAFKELRLTQTDN